MYRFFAYTFGAIAVLFISVSAGIALYLYKLSQDLPAYDSLANYEPPVTTRVYANDGTLIAEYARERRLFVPIEAIPRRVIDAFLSAEDKDFYSHPGVDFYGVMRAGISNMEGYLQGNGHRPEGASTITQQVAKNFLLSSEVSLERKIKEWMLAFRLESAYTKDKILELYLNEIFLGSNSYGVAAAAYNYFDKSLDQLTIAEVAYLAGLPKAPSNYHPVHNKARAIERRNYVIDRMEENNFINAEDAEKARHEDLVPHFRPAGAQSPDAQYFAEEIRRWIQQNYGDRALYDGGLAVRSTFDPRLQRIGTQALRDGLVAYDVRHGWRGPVSHLDLAGNWQKQFAAIPTLLDVPEWRLAVVTGFGSNDTAKIAFTDGTEGRIPFAQMKWARKYIRDNALGPQPRKCTDVLAAGDVIYVQALPDATDGSTKGQYILRQVPKLNGGLIAMDPQTGRVLALVGGFSFYASEFDRAWQAMRQTGSAFKPIVYAAALDSGYTPSSIVLDAPFVASQGVGLPMWRPENYDEHYAGPSTLRSGLEHSRNLMTVRIAADIGMEKVSEYAKRFGIADHMLPVLANALGSTETTLNRMAAAYSTFVNGGKRVVPALVDRIQDRTGKTIFRQDKRICEGCRAQAWANQDEPLIANNAEEILDPRTAYQIVHMLEGVVQRGTAMLVRDVGVPLAGKTGTTNDFKDAWFMGFSPNMVAGVYVGFDEPASMGHGETGGHDAAPVFREFMKAAIGDQPAVPFRIPPGVRMVRVDLHSGRPVNEGGIMEAFKAGTEPGSGYIARGDTSDSSAEGPTDEDPNATTQTGQSSGAWGLY
ncbi:MAG: PBP1A family penicillin-binding protein [Alphaproteobacteria bacterium]|nr:PBP1A family penicillin-binding protein [Alphaproteobacteria bacterium]